ncbi:MAG: hypothetical protein NW208_12900 [Bryobacter sp.]|nr:hypothetical protein [Bryobacter sp.]
MNPVPQRRQLSQRRQGQRGYALLFIFVLAGMAAVSLYTALPRAVFESQRAKEDLLVYRGQEYQRAIQLYYRKFRKYPMTLEELEKTSGQRFLRKRFVDPMTGSDEWRLINIVNGSYKDSKVIKPTGAQEQKLGTGFGGTDPNQAAANGQDPNDPAAMRRASDVAAADIGGQTNPDGTPREPAAPTDPNSPNNANVNVGAPGGNPGGNPNPPNTAPPPNTIPPSNQPPSNQPPAYVPGGVGASAPSTPSPATSPFPTLPSNMINRPPGSTSAGTSTSGQRPLTNEQLSPALNTIQRLLTTPRPPPAGLNIGNPSTTNAANLGAFPASGPALGGGNAGSGNPALTGIAGVASKFEGKGIKVINERERIEEWEFIYDPAKDQGGRPNANAQSQGQQGQPGQQGLGNSGFGNSGFGNQGRPGGGGVFPGGQPSTGRPGFPGGNRPIGQPGTIGQPGIPRR